MERKYLEKIYEKYFDILKFEIEVLNCKPTELRQLIGWLGELFCAIETRGVLSHVPNQHGYNVIARNGKKIGVITTAQKNGFVSVNKRTLGLRINFGEKSLRFKRLSNKSCKQKNQGNPKISKNHSTDNG